MALPEELVHGLSSVDGVVGVVVGGSVARGTADRHSDVDLGVYRRGTRLDLDALRALATSLDRDAVVAAPGEWGPWVDGGAWISTARGKVDLLWRDLDRVEQVLAEVRTGTVRCEAQVGHPLGFYSHAYLAELATAQVVADPDGQLARVRAELDPYPERLAEAVETAAGWEAGFCLEVAETAARRGDVLFVSGCLFRAVGCLVQVLHARDRRWLATEKGALAAAATLPGAPPALAERIGALLGAAGTTPEDLLLTLQRARELLAEVGLRPGSGD